MRQEENTKGSGGPRGKRLYFWAVENVARMPKSDLAPNKIRYPEGVFWLPNTMKAWLVSNLCVFVTLRTLPYPRIC